LIVDRPEELTHFNGMTLRDYFAAKAMQSFLGQEKRYSNDWKMFSSKAYDVADAMLKAREVK
jgi:hypothetical protein